MTGARAEFADSSILPVVKAQEVQELWAATGNLVEVFDNLQEGDQVAVRGTDELRPGTTVTPHLTSSD